MTAILLSNPAAAATGETTPIVSSFAQDMRYTFYSSGLAKWFGMALTSTPTQSLKGWDGKGAPKRNRPTEAQAETSEEREAKVARVKIYPGNVEIRTGGKVIFNAIGEDYEGKALGGLEIKWSALHEEKNNKISISQQGDFSSNIPGTFIITAEIAGVREQVKVKVIGEKIRRNVKSKTEFKVSTRGPQEISRNSKLAPASSGGGALIAQKNANGKKLQASPKGMANVPRVTAMTSIDAETTWNSNNSHTFNLYNAVRGNMPGPDIGAGVGSGNFQISAPILALGGRGLDLNLGLTYNSRLWHKSDNTITFDIDRDWMNGWNLGFGKLMLLPNNDANKDKYVIIDGDGTRHDGDGSLMNGYGVPYTSRQTYEGHTTDGTWINYFAHGYKTSYDDTNNGFNVINGWAVHPDGTKVEYTAVGFHAVYPTRITDAHGNIVSISYKNNVGPEIETIVDTLGRAVRFHYDSSNLLTAITAPGLGGGERTLVRLAYRYLTLSDAGSNYGFQGGLATKVRRNSIPVLMAIYYPATNTGYWFGDDDSYSRYGMIRKVSQRVGMTFSGGLNEQGSIGPGTQTHVLIYSNPGVPGYSDSIGQIDGTPTYTQMSEDWSGRQTDSNPTTYFNIAESNAEHPLYSIHKMITTITRSDGVKNVQEVERHSTATDDGYGYIPGKISYNSYSYVDNKVFSNSGTRVASTWMVYTGGLNKNPKLDQTDIYNELGHLKRIKYVYDYGTGATLPKEIIDGGKRIVNEFMNQADYIGQIINSGTMYATWQGPHILNLVKSVDVYESSSGSRLSRSEYEYDGKSLIDAPGVPMYDRTYNPHTPPDEYCRYEPEPGCEEGCNVPPGMECPEPSSCEDIYVCDYYPVYNERTRFRGNLTKLTKYADAVNLDLNSAIVENFTYDITGNLRIQSTACCEQASFNYTPNTGYAWPESVTHGSVSDSTSQNTTRSVYDFNIGVVLESYDANDRRSTVLYDANSLRPVVEYSPTGGTVHHAYSDAEAWVVDAVYEAGKSGAQFASWKQTFMDGRGQVRAVNIPVPSNGNYVVTTTWTRFDNQGRLWMQSLPYQSGIDTLKWNITEYDSLDRPIKIFRRSDGVPDEIVAEKFYNESTKPSAATSIGKSNVRSRDSWGRERWGTFDEQNRLVEVVEPNPSGDGTVTNGGLSTRFEYDTLGNLKQVNQGDQVRKFGYDSLGRLTHQKLAEREGTLDSNGNWTGSGGWSDVFRYDNRSNLIWKKDARGVITHFGYENDPLNRLQTVIYSKSDAPTAADI